MTATAEESGINLALPPTVAVALPPNPTAKTQSSQHDAQTSSVSYKEERQAAGLDFPILAWLVIVHLGALTAPFVFSWPGLGLFMALYWLTGSIGICLGFHRLFTHRSFKTSRIMRRTIAFIGGLAGEGPAIHWVANHRKHHAFSDQPGDPHSPHDGAWWSHVFWMIWRRSSDQYVAYNQRWAPDLVTDPVLRFFDRTFILWHVLLSLLLFAIGYFIGGYALAWSLVVWGMFVRTTVVLHSTWLVNSASHMWGYRSYQSNDDSRNNWLVALLTFGEGWHNNHHAFPTMARAGHRWWEIDVTFWVIRGLERCGLIWDVIDGQHQTEAGRRRVLTSAGTETGTPPHES